MRKRFVAITLLCSLLTGCGKQNEIVTKGVATAMEQQSAYSIFKEAEENALSYNFRSIIINQYNGKDLVSTTEIYGNLEDDTYEVLYVDKNGDENIIKTQCSQESSFTTRYILTEYGWVMADGNDTWRETFMNVFDFITPESLTLVSDSEYEFSDDAKDCYLLEQVTKSEDGSQIYYIGVYVNKDYMVPELASLQVYNKADGTDTDEYGNAYTNVISESTAYLFGYFKEGDSGYDAVIEATSIPTENVITSEEYSNMYWKEVENGETDN